MEFALNDVLQGQLKEYDVKKNNNPLIRSSRVHGPKRDMTRPLKKVTFSRFTLGKVTGLLPVEIVSEVQQLAAVADICNSCVDDRIRVWRDENQKIYALIAHYEQLWYSFWIAPKGSDYYYGCTAICKDTIGGRGKVFDGNRYRIYGTRRMSASSVINIDRPYEFGFSAEECDRVQIGRSFYLKKTVLVDKEALDKGFHYLPWSQPHVCNQGHGKDSSNRKIRAEITKQMQENPIFPVWTDETFSIGMRRQGRNNTIWYCLSQLSFSGWNNHRLLPHNIVECPEQFRNTMEWWTAYYKAYLPNGDFFSIDPAFIDKPAVQAILRKAVNDTQYMFDLAQTDDTAHWKRGPIAVPFMNFEWWLFWCDWIRMVWPSCPQDLLVNNYDLLLKVKPTTINTQDSKTLAWLRTYMPVKSLFGIFTKGIALLDEEYASHDKARLRFHHSALSMDEKRNGMAIYKITDFSDTLTSIKDILASGRQLDKPSRWRLTDFHDYVVGEAWKIRNADFDLPQDMFPKPVTNMVNGVKYTIIQPCSAHQLAQWGQAARNCVGGSGYSSDIRAKKHFILMVMLDHKPRYTVQMKLSGTTLHVSQMKDIANRNLDATQKRELEEALNKALNRRTEELEPTGGVEV